MAKKKKGMTPEQKKRLNEWLGWLGEPLTFTEPADYFAAWDRLVEKGEALEFTVWSYQQFCHLPTYTGRLMHHHHTVWLHSKEPDGTYKLINLVIEAIEKGVVKE